MTEFNSKSINPSADITKTCLVGQFELFNDLKKFATTIEENTGFSFDFSDLVELATDFMQSTNDYLILYFRTRISDTPYFLLFLTQTQAFLYSEKTPSYESYKDLEDICDKPYGRATALAFIILNKVLDSYKDELDKVVQVMQELEQHFELKRYREINFELERLTDRMEDFHSLCLRLQETRIKQIDTRLISFDYSVFLAESMVMQGRGRRRLSLVKDLMRDNELQTTTELNKRIERLNDVVRKLTAITVVLMIPTLIASHFGMNFANMPELKLDWVYPAVVVFQIIFVGGAFWLFKKIGWL